MSTENTNENLVNLTIDGKSVSVKAGTTIIEAARKAGVNVPHFCWHPGLSVAGVCRLCMVKVEGNPKMQIACNTPVTEGMRVDSQAREAKEAQKWALEFHLVNHPLDCPICDQAGECKLQDFYMEVGRYDSQVAENKVLKPKALDVGTYLVLDTERCILCSRCVRFEEEVTKTNGLGIFNRGDRSIIGLLPGKKLEHNYTYNLADICPVGAFTAKDFRFKCRVWFLSETKTICPGCSTGCNVFLHQNRSDRNYHRLKPRHNEEVNGHWMCDYGRSMYEHLNAASRNLVPTQKGRDVPWQGIGGELREVFRNVKHDRAAVVLTPQYTNEEYEGVLSALSRVLGGVPQVFVWRPASERIEDFDGLLFRGDRNPNTRGMEEILKAKGIEPVRMAGDFSALAGMNPELTVILGPEVGKAYPDLEAELARFAELPEVVYLGSAKSATTRRFRLSIPTKTYAEKSGTYVNFKGIAQKLTANPPVVPGILGADEVFAQLEKAPH